MKSEQELRERIKRLELARKEVSDMYHKESSYAFEDYCSDLAEIKIEMQTLLWVLGN